jgi:hypothetical protein
MGHLGGTVCTHQSGAQGEAWAWTPLWHMCGTKALLSCKCDQKEYRKSILISRKWERMTGIEPA